MRHWSSKVNFIWRNYRRENEAWKNCGLDGTPITFTLSSLCVQVFETHLSMNLLQTSLYVISWLHCPWEENFLIHFFYIYILKVTLRSNTCLWFFRVFHARSLKYYEKSMEEALQLANKINAALAVHDKKVRPNAGGEKINQETC